MNTIAKFIALLMKGFLVLQTLIGIKTMTRRTKGLEYINQNPDNWKLVQFVDNKAWFDWPKYGQWIVKCPYRIGDIVWIREQIAKYADEIYYAADWSNGEVEGWKGKWIPSIHMPKSACRLFLQIISVKLERLHDISEQDAIREGIEELRPWPEAPSKRRFKYYLPAKDSSTESAVFDPIMSFFSLWEFINGNDSVLSNPWVWVIEFKMVPKPETFA
jgi:hypothetical protein